jgi:O-antigen/teichoic acid export membrane protein
MRPALATNSVVFALLLGSLAVGVLGGTAILVPAIVGHARTELLLLVLVSIPIQLVGGYLFRLVQSDYRFGRSNLAWIAAPLATVSVNATLFAVGSLSVRSALCAWVAGQTLQAVLLIRETGRAFGFGLPNYRLARKTIRFGARVYPTTFMSFTNYRLDQWLLGTLSTRRELGFYSVAVSWAEALFFLPTAIGYAQRPTLVRARRSLATKQAAAAFRIATGLTLLLVVCMIAAAPILCVLTFGRPFRESILDLRILTVGAFGILSLKLLGNAITAQGDPLKQSAATGVAFVFTVVLDVLLIPRYDDLGAAVASVVAYNAGGVAMIVLFIRATNANLLAFIPGRKDVIACTEMLTRTLRRASPAGTGDSAIK